MNKQKNIFFIMAIMLAALIFVVISIYDGSEMDEADLVSYKESLDSLKKGDYNLDQYLVLVSQIAYSKDPEERRNLSSQMRKTEGSIVECISQSKLILDNAIYTEDEAAAIPAIAAAVNPTAIVPAPREPKAAAPCPPVPSTKLALLFPILLIKFQLPFANFMTLAAVYIPKNVVPNP